ncbi:MAG: aminotransferase class I/II-fold pyridoxal phosphate-dependent enzyme, partial [Caulobacteraceae bacterium]
VAGHAEAVLEARIAVELGVGAIEHQHHRGRQALMQAADLFGADPGAGGVGRLHEGLPPSVVLVLDGAYAEFNSDPGFEDGLGMARHADDIVVTRTFSKIHGLAALRVGWGYLPAEMASAVDRIRLPFNINIPAQLAAVAALGDDGFVARSLALVEQWRPWLTQQISGLGLDVVPSAANFVLVGFPAAPGRTAVEAEAFLATKGLLTRGVGNYGLPGHLRITIGLEQHNRAVVEGLAEFMGQ